MSKRKEESSTETSKKQKLGGYPPNSVWSGLDTAEEWIRAGCGDTAYNCPEKNATFAADGKTPDKMPDLSEHTSFMAEVLKANPGLWDELKDKKTSNGVTLGQCIKCGIDNKGHPMIKIVGMTAGDPESYEVFAPLFDPVISARHGGYAADGKQPTNLDISQLSDIDIDPDCKYVLTTRVRTGRSVAGFKFPPIISFEERRKLEALVVKGLLSMEGDLKGDYFPLHGSKSYAPKPEGMSEAEEDSLRKMGNLFQEPDSTLLLASGMARHWPDGRGVFHNNDKNLFVWVGEEDHMRIVSMQGNRETPSEIGKNIKEVTARFIRACDAVQKVLKEEGADFVHNDHLGWVLTCPSNLGTGLRAGTMVKLEQVTTLVGKDFKKLCGSMRLQARGTGGVDSVASTTWDISNADRIGKGEVDLVNILIEGAAQMVKWEKALEGGGDGAEAAKAEIMAKIAAPATAGCIILGAGNPLLDISANVPTEVLAKYGVKSGDIILAEEKHMGVYEELVSKHAPVDYIAGGATQNSIRVASWMSKGATPCAFVGCVGKDANADLLKERCTAAGVTAAYMVDETAPTGKCACLITPDGERCLITDLQAANNYKSDHLKTPESQALIQIASIIYSAGFFLTSGGPTCTKLLGEACAASSGKRFCLNLSAPFICEFFTAVLDETMPFVDVLFGNETEAAALGKVKGWGDDIKKIALEIAALPQAEGKAARMVVITQGASATIVAHKGFTTEYAVEPLARELLVDTNGAGDAFVGGFLSQLAKGRDVAACCAAGNFAARHIIQRSGCTMADTCEFKSE